MEYIIFNYGDAITVADTFLPRHVDGLAHVTSDVLWEILSLAKKLDLKISVYELGPCILAWS